MVTAEQTRKLITGGDPDGPCGIPTIEQFGDLDFLPDKRLEDVGQMLMSRRFPQVDGLATVDFLWKAKGGSSGGSSTLGKCIKNSGLVRHYSNQTDYTIWVAADHLRDHRFNRYQLEALLFHELMHILVDDGEDEGDPVTKKTRGHDTELFYAEIEHYGLWKRDLERLPEVVQPALPFPDRASEIVDGVAEAARRMVKDTIRPGSGIDGITFSAPGSGLDPVTITREDADRIRHQK